MLYTRSFAGDDYDAQEACNQASAKVNDFFKKNCITRDQVISINASTSADTCDGRSFIQHVITVTIERDGTLPIILDEQQPAPETIIIIEKGDPFADLDD